MKRRLICALTAAAILALTVGCGGGGGKTEMPTGKYEAPKDKPVNAGMQKKDPDGK